MLIENTKGGYSFLKGSAPYSAGVVASSGFRIEHARLSKPLPIAAAFERIDAHLKALGRPSQALCAMELRSPKPYTFQGFGDFNAGYVKFLEKRDIPVNGLNPVARTNVAPEIAPPSEPVIYACSYTVPSRQASHSFVVAGAGELPEGTNIDPHDVIRRGETSPDALLEKAKFVLGLMDGRVKNLGMKWDDVTTVDVYTIHNIHPFLASQIVPKVGNAHHGITWHYTRPPITSIEFEMDVRGCPNELVIAS
ncbi:MAG: RidA family protein [Bryobacteraceae bacterium]